MFSFREFVQRLRFLSSYARIDRELAEEISEHIRRKTEENMAHGMPADEAHYAALRQFGNIALQQERSRESWGFPSLESFVRDLRFGGRLMRKTPVITVAAIVTLALGIGANTAVITVARSAIWRTFPYPDPDRLAILWSSNQKTGWTEMQVSVPDVEDWKARTRSFDSISGFTWTNYTIFNVSDEHGAERIRGVSILPNLLETLGMRPALGRGFGSDEFASGANHVVLITDAMWRRRFGGDPEILGRSIHLNREEFRVVGILPPNFEVPDLEKAPELFVPLALDSADAHSRSRRIIVPVGRLRTGVSRATAKAEMQAVAQQLAHDFPKDDGQYSVNPDWVSDNESARDARQKMPLFFATMGLVLLIATSNVATLIIARLATRTHEITMRIALGASRRRVLRQMVTEALLLAGVAGLAAAFMARWFVQLILFYKPFYMNTYEAHFGPAAIVSGLALCIVTGAILGLLPSLSTPKSNAGELLARIGSHASAGAWHSILRRLLVMSEVGICVALLAAAALMIRTIHGLNAMDIGFNPRGLVMARMTLDANRYRSPANYLGFYNDLVGRLRSQPGMQSVMAISHIDFGGYDMGYEVRAEGEPPPLDPKDFPLSGASVVMPGYFRDMQATLLRGREFLEHESVPSVIINQALARKLFRDADPIGRLLIVGGTPLVSDEGVAPGSRTIIGVVPDVKKYAEFLKKPFPQFYLPFEQNPVPSMYVLVRSDNPEAAMMAIRKTVSSIDQELPVYWADSMKAKIDEWYAAQHFQTIVLSCFAALALIICLSGLYTVISYSVSQRTAELGIRLALGAEPRRTVLMMMQEGVWLIAAGTMAGLLLAARMGRLMQSLLYQVKPMDPAIFAFAAALVIATASVAIYIPSRRAAHIDPITALRTL